MKRDVSFPVSMGSVTFEPSEIVNLDKVYNFRYLKWFFLRGNIDLQIC